MTLRARWENYNKAAIELYRKGQYDQAEGFALKSLKFAIDSWGTESDYVATSLNNLGEIYRQLGLFEEQKECLITALKIDKKIYGDDHISVAADLNNLGALYDYKGDYQDATSCYLQALDIYEKDSTINSINIATILNNLGATYYNQGCLSDAESYYLRSISIKKEKLGLNHREMALSLRNFAELYRSLGRFKDAESYLLQAININKEQLGEEHPDTFSLYNSLAVVYICQGRFSEAELYLCQLLTFRGNKLGLEHPLVATIYNNLAIVYRNKGDLDQAELYHLKSLHIKERKIGEDHLDTATSLDNLAGFYYHTKQYKKSEIYYKKSLAIKTKKLGEDHPNTAITYSNLASLYYAMGRVKEAEDLYLKSLSIRKERLGEDHPDMATSLNNLASFYLLERRYKEAQQKYTLSIKICENKLGLFHPDTIKNLNNVAILHQNQGSYFQSLMLMQESLLREHAWLDIVFPHATANDKLKYIDNIRSHLDGFLSLITQNLALTNYSLTSQRQETMIAGLEMTLNRKAVTLATSAALNSALYGDRHPHLKADFQQLRQLQEQRAALYSQPYNANTHAGKQKLLQEVGEQIRELEIKLAQAVPEFKLSKQTCDRQALALKLPHNSTLIEFVRFRLYDFKEKIWGAARYIAFIYMKVPLNKGDLGGSSADNMTQDHPQPPLQKGENIEMIDLGNADKLDELIQEFREQIIDAKTVDDLAPRARRKQSQTKKKLVLPDAQALQEKLIKPLEPYLTSPKLILATDGLLNLVPFAALHDFAPDQTLHYLNSGRELLREDIHGDRPCAEPLILADPNFNYPHQEAPEHAEIHFDREESLVCRILGESVAQKLGVTPCLGDDAWSSKLTKLSSPRILLIATHGYYTEEQVHIPRQTSFQQLESIDSLREKLPEDLPMYRSGLAMTGANTMLNNEALPSAMGSGILYAEDIAALDLWNTELVVLSACQTGMGDIKDGEGVFGLRRAFALAGAKTVIMSLWSVPARATALLMDRLFDEVEKQDTQNYAIALKSAQDYVRTVTVADLETTQIGKDILEELQPSNLLTGNPNQQPLKHPVFWAAWICQGS